MKRSTNKITSVIFLFFVLTVSTINAQPWITETNKDNFFDIQRDFETYWQGKDIERGKGWKPFKRWENYWQYRVNPDGTFPAPNYVFEQMQEYLKTHPDNNRSINALSNWTSLGPNASGGGYAGLGRINAVAFHPTNSSIVFAGSSGGGLWKTTNGGTSWTVVNDNLGVQGVSYITFDPANSNIMYLATGDYDGGDNYSFGVLKSTDGGTTWATTGLSFAGSSYTKMSKIIVDSDDSNVIIATTNKGIYRSTNGGTSWTSSNTSVNFYDIEAKPGSSNTFYASSGSSIYRSIDNGATWTSIYTASGSARINMAVTPANGEYVYAVSVNSSSGFKALYRSTDGGTNFTSMSTSPNILGYNANGGDTGGQGWYDLTIAADPANAETVYVGGVNCWKSTNGGTSWTIKSHWSGTTGAQTVHADKHCLEWQGSVLWEGNDGGLYKTTDGGTNWTYLTSTMTVSQMYRIGASQTDNKAIAGLQDNGTKLLNNSSVWSDVIGGDGMECAIRPDDSNVMYGELYYGDIYRSTNGGSSFSALTMNFSGDADGAWVTPYLIDPSNTQHLYVAYKNVYKSTNQGTNFSAISTTTNVGSNLKTTLAIAPSNPLYVYVGNNAQLYRTTDGGTSWSTMTVPPSSGNVTMIRVHPTTPNTIFATCSNYSNGNKVFKSIDGGATWTNISGTLPNIGFNCIELDKNSASNAMYIGSDSGVFYRDDTSTDWSLFNTNLPNVEVTELEINYYNNHIYAATFGRSLWRTDISTCKNPYNLATSNIGSTTTTFSWSAPSPAPSSYQYAYTTTATPPATGTTTTATSVVITGLSPGTAYYYHVRSFCSPSTYTPWQTIGPIVTSYGCSTNFYDTGGASAAYNNNENYSVTICSDNPTSTIVKATFSAFNVEATWDALYVFNGPSTASPMIASTNPATQAGFPAGGYYGTSIPGPFTSTDASGCLTFQFMSDSDVTTAGWSSAITCAMGCATNVENLNDSGYASLRQQIICATAGSNIAFLTALSGDTISLSSPILIDKNLSINVPTGVNIYVKAANGGPVFQVQSGITFSLNNITLLGGTNASGNTVINNGTLNLEGVTIKSPNSANTAVKNNSGATLNVFGINNIQIGN